MRRNRTLWMLIALLLLVGGVIFILASPDTVNRLLRRDATWQAMQTNGIWRVGMDPSFPPFEWLDENGQPIGYDVELARLMAAEWRLTVEIVPVGFDSLGDAVQTGRIDSVVSALPFDERLTRNMAYSEPYFDAGIALAVRSGSTIQSVADLAGQRVAVEWGSMGDMVGRRLAREDASIALERFDSPNAAVTALVEGATADGQEIDALLIDNVTLRMEVVRGSPIAAAGPILESNPYVIAMPIHAYELQSAVAETLTTLREQGVLLTLEEEWFGRDHESLRQ